MKILIYIFFEFASSSISFDFSSGRYKPLTRLVPSELFTESSETNEEINVPRSSSSIGLSSLSAAFSQFVLEEILEADEIACAANTLSVKNDSFMWEAETGLDQHGVPVPINTATSWIDGSAIYGGTSEKEAFQREFKDGRVLLCERDEGCFVRHKKLRETKMLPSVITFVWHRYHNAVAESVKLSDEGLSDEAIYRQTKRLVISTLQNIIWYEWLPLIVGANFFLPEDTAYLEGRHNGHDPHIDPRVSVEFAAASRALKSTLPTLLPIADENDTNTCAFKNSISGSMRLCEDPKFDKVELLLGLSRQFADNVNSDYEDFEKDAKNAAEFEIPALSDVRNFLHFSDSQDSDLAFFPGLIAEADSDTLRKLIALQMQKIRHSDWRWFENFELNSLVESDDVARISATTWLDVLSMAFGDSFDWNGNGFQILAPGGPCVVDANVEEIVLECTKKQRLSNLVQAIISAIIVLLVILAIYLTMVFWTKKERTARQRRESMIQIKPTNSQMRRYTQFGQSVLAGPGALAQSFQATEIECTESFEDREVTIGFEKEGDKPCINVMNNFGEMDQYFIHKMSDPNKSPSISGFVAKNRRMDTLLLKNHGRKDLYLEFASTWQRNVFVQVMKSFTINNGVELDLKEELDSKIDEMAMSGGKRKKLIEDFLQKAFTKMVGKDDDEDSVFTNIVDYDDEHGQLILSQIELGQLFGQRQSSTFIQTLYNAMDLTDSGEVHVVEFIKFLTRLTENDPSWRAEILQKQYKDSMIISKEGVEKIVGLITKSSVGKDIKDLHEACKAMMKGLGIKSREDQSENELFIQLMLSTSKVSRRFTVPRTTNRRYSRYRVRSLVMKDEEQSFFGRFIPKKVRRIFEQKRRHLYTLFIFFGIIVALMVDRIYFFLFLNESAGIRQITEVGLLMSRSTAAALSFIYPMMLLSMSRNLLTRLRQKAINQYIPFDQSVEFHKLAAYVGAFLSLIHVIGHFLNFYFLSEAPYQAASCVLPQIFSDDEPEKSFFQLLWASHQGITGLLLVLIMSIIYVFAAAQSRRKRHKVFWKTHMLYPIFFILLSLHGLQALLQEPKFVFYLLGPGIIFLIDKIIELRRSYVEVPLKEFDLLQSSVTCLRIKRPKSFDYHSGQWIRIALPEVSKWEFHPFTLTSCPADDFISCHVRAVGPWTISLREHLKKVKAGKLPVPRMYVDGPIGEGHQNWHKFECSVLVGAGIGITPFASILKDIVGRNMSMTKCKKVVFIWVKRSDKQFEWMVDILKEAEKNSNMIETHVFITQKKDDFDLRTRMRYFLEHKLDSPCGKSLFTGLRTVTHFGRPDFNELLEDVQQKNSAIGKIGVFSCGPPALSKAVDKAAKNLNKSDNALFEHFFENF